MNYIQERLISPPGGILNGEPAAVLDGSIPQTSGMPIGRIGGDAINMLRRPMGNAMNGGALSIFSQLIGIIQQLLSSFGLGFGSQTQGAQTYFGNATASSLGDPHLAFNGTDDSGKAHDAHFDSMQAHKDLLDSASFTGGYRLSTAVTQPGANGVTYNRKATVATNFGNTRVSLDNAGNATVASDGQTLSVANGQTIDLGDGETVSRNADGSLVVTDQNALGGTITTRLSENGSGVDVNVEARNVDLGGDLLNGQSADPRQLM